MRLSEGVITNHNRHHLPTDKMLKKTLISLAALAIAASASAEFRWGPAAGINISNMRWKQKLLQTNTLVGPQAGLMGEIMIPGIGFGIDLALKYSANGSTLHFGEHEVWAADGIGTAKVWVHQLQIPLNLRFKWTRMEGVEQYIAPFVYGGPVFNFNIATTDCPAIEHPAASFALQCGIGAELFEHWQISGGYLWGFSYELRTIKLDNFSASQRGWQINLAYLF